MSSDEEVLLRVKTETVKILKDRGYYIPPEENFFLKEPSDSTLEEFRYYLYNVIIPVPDKKENLTARDIIAKEKKSGISIRNRLSQFYYKPPTAIAPEYNCFVFFASSEGNDNMKKEEVGYYKKIILDYHCNYGFIISEKKIFPPTHREIKDITAISYTKPGSGTITQTYMYSELLYTPTENVFCPKHIILSKEQVTRLIVESTMTETQLSKISVNDPYIKRLGAVPSDVIQIERESFIDGTLIDEEITFRRVYVPTEVKKAKVVRK